MHPSTDISVDISTDTRLLYWSTYQPTLDWCIVRHTDWLSADIMTEICQSTYPAMYQLRYRPSQGQHFGRLSADILVDIPADTRLIRWPLIVSRISPSVVYWSKALTLSVRCISYMHCNDWDISVSHLWRVRLVKYFAVTIREHMVYFEVLAFAMIVIQDFLLY